MLGEARKLRLIKRALDQLPKLPWTTVPVGPPIFVPDVIEEIGQYYFMRPVMAIVTEREEDLLLEITNLLKLKFHKFKVADTEQYGARKALYIEDPNSLSIIRRTFIRALADRIEFFKATVSVDIKPQPVSKVTPALETRYATVNPDTVEGISVYDIERILLCLDVQGSVVGEGKNQWFQVNEQGAFIRLTRLLNNPLQLTSSQESLLGSIVKENWALGFDAHAPIFHRETIVNPLQFTVQKRNEPEALELKKKLQAIGISSFINAAYEVAVTDSMDEVSIFRLAALLGREKELGDLLKHYWAYLSIVQDARKIINPEVGTLNVRQLVPKEFDIKPWEIDNLLPENTISSPWPGLHVVENSGAAGALRELTDAHRRMAEERREAKRQEALGAFFTELERELRDKKPPGDIHPPKAARLREGPPSRSGITSVASQQAAGPVLDTGLLGFNEWADNVVEIVVVDGDGNVLISPPEPPAPRTAGAGGQLTLIPGGLTEPTP